MDAREMESRITELRHALNNAVQAAWDFQGVTNLLLNSAEYESPHIPPEVRAVISIVNERATSIAKAIEEVL